MGFEYKPEPTPRESQHWCNLPNNVYGLWWDIEGYSSDKDATGTVWSCDECGRRYRWGIDWKRSIDYASWEYGWKRVRYTFFRKTTNKGDNNES